MYMDDKMVDNGRGNTNESNRMLNEGDVFDIFHILCINYMPKILSKRPSNALGFINASSLHNDQRPVSTTHVAILRMVRKIMQI